MAKAGMLIPAQSPAKVPYFHGVYADIGDEQSLQQNLSTFSGHIQRIRGILEQLTPNCLVLLDEVGAGTHPSEGVAIAGHCWHIWLNTLASPLPPPTLAN